MLLVLPGFISSPDCVCMILHHKSLTECWIGQKQVWIPEACCKDCLLRWHSFISLVGTLLVVFQPVRMFLFALWRSSIFSHGCQEKLWSCEPRFWMRILTFPKKQKQEDAATSVSTSVCIDLYLYLYLCLYLQRDQLLRNWLIWFWRLGNKIWDERKDWRPRKSGSLSQEATCWQKSFFLRRAQSLFYSGLQLTGWPSFPDIMEGDLFH
jgi:hypothetical protein